ncbi:hypothetical protein R3P38DRAFT_929008 [Favolaschia claudopus]|uniref:Ribosomal protein S11 n=1 Tax=Favolaschia claudopus TaxID=2862362 RepID=A0AAW0BQS8_9AGAR
MEIVLLARLRCAVHTVEQHLGTSIAARTPPSKFARSAPRSGEGPGSRFRRLGESRTRALSRVWVTAGWMRSFNRASSSAPGSRLIRLIPTIHCTRSSAATTRLSRMIFDKYSAAVPSSKEQQHSRISKDATANAFSDGKICHEHRSNRSLGVETACALLSSAQLQLRVYESTLATSLELKRGAASLLSKLKYQGKDIAVITRSARCAGKNGQWVTALGIAEQIDFLTTTNHLGVRFHKVLQLLGVRRRHSIGG